MQIRTNNEGYIIAFHDDTNPSKHVMDCDIFPATEITVKSRRDLLNLKKKIDEILNIEEGKAKSHKRK